MFEFNFCFTSPIWTDVLQAVAAAVAIPGAIAAFWKLFEKNKELERAIFELRKIASATKDRADLDERKHLLSMRPRLKVNGVSSSGSEIKPWIENHGETAFIMAIEDLVVPALLYNRTAGLNNRWELKKDGHFQLSCSRIDGQNWNAPSGEIDYRITYEDREGNLYEQLLQGPVSSQQLSITTPKMIQRKKYEE